MKKEWRQEVLEVKQTGCLLTVFNATSLMIKFIWGVRMTSRIFVLANGQIELLFVEMADCKKAALGRG
jgi:hypothetical protein